MKDESERIDAFLAKRGVCARRKVQELLDSHRVEQLSQRILRSGERIDPNVPVLVDGKVIKSSQHYYIALNKPIRYLCSNFDNEGRSLAIGLIEIAKQVRLYNVGRLDYFSQGLLIFTNDGEFAKRLMHPSFEVEKEYQVELERPLNRVLLKKISLGLHIDGVEYQVRSIKAIGAKSYRLVLIEGKNREIRRIFAYLGCKITKLERVRIGEVQLGQLALGQWRELTFDEVRSFSH